VLVLGFGLAFACLFSFSILCVFCFSFDNVVLMLFAFVVSALRKRLAGKNVKQEQLLRWVTRARAKWAEKWEPAEHLFVGELGPNTMWPGQRPTSVPSDILIHPAVWPQDTSVTRQTDNGPIA